MRWIVSGHAVTKQAAPARQMGRFETELLATDANVEALAEMNLMWIDKVHGRYVAFQVVEVVVPRELFRKILRLIDGLRPAPLPP
jgi:hypothetical protein